MSVNLDAHFAVHEQAVRARGLRTKLLASNIANVDTPNYKATDLAFGDTLAAARAGGAAGGATSRVPGAADRATLPPTRPSGGTHPAHLRLAALAGPGADTAPGRVMYRYPDAPSLDGNTVDKDTEQARFAENAVRYRASLQFLGSRAASLIRALKGE